MSKSSKALYSATLMLVITGIMTVAGVSAKPMSGNPIIGAKYKYNLLGTFAGSQGLSPPAAQTQADLLNETFVVNVSPKVKKLANESNVVVTQFQFTGYLLEFVDYSASDPTKLIVTSFYDDPSTLLRTSNVTNISNTSSASTLAKITVPIYGNVLKFGPWQGHSVHVTSPQDRTSPPAPGSGTLFTEDWQDTNLVSGMSIQKFLGAQVQISGGYLTISGGDNAYVVITLPANVVCLAMYGITPMFVDIPTLNTWGIIFLIGTLLIIAVYILSRQRQKSRV